MRGGGGGGRVEWGLTFRAIRSEEMKCFKCQAIFCEKKKQNIFDEMINYFRRK